MFFLLFFEPFAFVVDAAAGALACAAALAAAALSCFFDERDFFAAGALAAVDGVAVAGAGVAADGAGVALEVVGAGAGAGAGVAVAAGFAVPVFAFAPVGGVVEPPIVRPAASRWATDFAPRPFTRFARSSASLNGPFFARSSMIAFDFTGPRPFTDSSAAWSAVLTSTAAASAAVSESDSATTSISSFFSMAGAPF
ncbi:helix-hairpin-helix motif domain protein [Burkholderia pseudomallei]|nr:helix-hairpin-helix motif domain protein [Burkholderia pseudomallei]